MRVRFRFAKVGKVRWTSHRDVARMWERAFRRTRMPLAYTEGFSPRPKIAFGLALPTGHESIAEYLDIELVDAVDLTPLAHALTGALPAGIDVTGAAEVDTSEPSLQHAVTSCTWEIDTGDGVGDLAELAANALAAPSLVVRRERKGRETDDDIRPALLDVRVEDARLVCDLATVERGVRPVELLRAIAPGLEPQVARRTHQWIERDGARWEPIPLAATGAPHAEVRAS